MTSTVLPHSRPLALHADRFFDPDATIRGLARELYESVATLPLICPHGHVDPWLLADNAPFPEPTSLLLIPDHYIFRMLYSQGVAMEQLGVPTQDGTPVEQDPRRIWQTFAAHWHLFRGTPTRAWLDHELYELFGVRVRLDEQTAMYVYDQIAECLSSPEFRPRALFDRFRIEVLATTDAASDDLIPHRRIRESGWAGRVIPTFRPDAVMRIASPGWLDAMASLERVHGAPIPTATAMLECFASRRKAFAALGATATDHAVVRPFTQRLTDEALEELFTRARAGVATLADQEAFEAHMLMEMARLSTEDGLVMQLHPGSWRDHHTRVHARFGTDKGADIPVSTEYTRNLAALLNAYGAHPNFTMIVFTLDESAYARELAPMAGHYPALRLGPAWWFHDSLEGMRRFRANVMETAGLRNTAGFNDDTRAFCSIPARHDLSRRVDANWLARLVAEHVIEMDEAMVMARELAYDLARRAYRFDHARPAGAEGLAR